MGMAWTKRLAAAAIVSLLAAGHAAYAQDAAPPQPATASAYLTQNFSFHALTPEVQATLAHANLAAVPFTKITLHTRDTATSPDHPQPTTFSSASSNRVRTRPIMPRATASGLSRTSVRSTGAPVSVICLVLRCSTIVSERFRRPCYEHLIGRPKRC